MSERMAFQKISGHGLCVVRALHFDDLAQKFMLKDDVDERCSRTHVEIAKICSQWLKHAESLRKQNTVAKRQVPEK